MQSLLLALTLLPHLIASYDCSTRNLPNVGCSLTDTGSLNAYSQCMIRQYSFSAFIQCASQLPIPSFSASGGDSTKSASPIEILLNALFESATSANPIPNPATGDCNLARNIKRAADEHGDQPFASYLCNTYHPRDAGLRCLQIGLIVRAPEHSLEAFCKGVSGRNKDLMNAPELQDASDDSSSSGGGDGGGDSTAAASSSEAFTPVETDSAGFETTQTLAASSVPTTSPVLSAATPTSGTSTAPAVAATPTTGAASNERVVYLRALSVLGLTALLVLIVF